jgi:hypothetical protein
VEREGEGHMIERIVIKTTYPCCGGQSRLSAITALPKEGYTRRCFECGTVWDVRRYSTPFLEDGFIHRLEWQDVAGREYRQRYG